MAGIVGDDCRRGEIHLRIGCRLTSESKFDKDSAMAGGGGDGMVVVVR